MPKIKYKEIKMRKDTRALVTQVNEIISEYQSQGYSLTLRQVYYQLVARGLIPNNDKSYRVVGNAVNDGRLAGLIDWHAIEDRTRRIRTLSHWNSPAGIIVSAMHSYYMDHWEGQEYYVEIWVEKDALISIVETVAQKWDVPCFSCRGYTSQSEMWAAAQRFTNKTEVGKNNILIHLGDHDPSGIDMTRDIEDRLRFFGTSIEVNRIALNRDQVDAYKPPPNPAKITDSRARDYIKTHGKVSWELDALRPDVLEGLIEGTVLEYLDMALFEEVETAIQFGKKQLQSLSDNWDKVSQYKFMKEVK